MGTEYLIKLIFQIEITKAPEYTIDKLLYWFRNSNSAYGLEEWLSK